jgi:hypothetical protein
MSAKMIDCAGYLRNCGLRLDVARSRARIFGSNALEALEETVEHVHG